MREHFGFEFGGHPFVTMARPAAEQAARARRDNFPAADGWSTRIGTRTVRYQRQSADVFVVVTRRVLSRCERCGGTVEQHRDAAGNWRCVPQEV
jgi:hypothetical protein